MNFDGDEQDLSNSVQHLRFQDQEESEDDIEEQDLSDKDDPGNSSPGTPSRSGAPVTTIEDETELENDGNVHVAKPATPAGNRSYAVVDPYSHSELVKFEERNKLLAPLFKQYNESQLDDVTVKQVITMLKALEAQWTLEGECGLKDVSPLLRLTLRNLGYAEDVTHGLIQDDVHKRLSARGFYPAQKLQMFMLRLRLMANPSDPTGSSQYEARIMRVLEIMFYGGEMFYSANTSFQLILNKPRANVTPNYFHFKPAVDYNDRNVPGYARLIMFAFTKLHAKQYRRCGGDCYRPIFTKGGDYTRAWERVMTIAEFVDGMIDLNVNGEAMRDLVKGSLHTKDHLAKFLTTFKTDLFPDLELNRYLFAFRDGIYYTYKDVYIPYKNIRDDGTNPGEFALGEHAFENKYVCCKYFDMPFDYMDWPTLLERKPQVAGVEAGLARELLLAESIPTPHFETILDSQDFDSFTKFFVYGLLGRALYWAKERDNWQVCLYMLGYGGTGKSTILKLLRMIYPNGQVGILANNVERQWALASIWNKWLVMSYEVKQNFKLDQAEFQSCLSSEEVSVCEKMKTAFAHVFLAPIFLAGNEMVNTWRDSSGSLRRRLIILAFLRLIDKKKVDPSLQNNLTLELPNFIQKINKYYIILSNLYGNEDIIGKLPEQLDKMHKEAMLTMNPITNFISNSGFFESGSERFCNMIDFKAMFKRFCIAEGLKQPVLDPTQIRGALQMINLDFVTDSRSVDSQPPVRGTWILGVDFTADAKETIRSNPGKFSNFAAATAAALAAQAQGPGSRNDSAKRQKNEDDFDFP